jgi:hypothetical protein
MFLYHKAARRTRQFCLRISAGDFSSFFWLGPHDVDGGRVELGLDIRNRDIVWRTFASGIEAAQLWRQETRAAGRARVDGYLSGRSAALLEIAMQRCPAKATVSLQQ